jgi:2-polyprenyl-3-methyl-5-hydroxy-6-metoxy-1,4-benzoquinol methylase
MVPIESKENTPTQKEELEEWYKEPDPWNFINSSIDLVRRKIFLRHLAYAFNQLQIRDVLDVGCGEGYLTLDLARTYDVIIDAFDISENAIKYAKQKNSAENIKYFAVDLRDFQTEKEYDLVICEEALYYLNDLERKQAVQKFYNLLRDNAFLKFSDISIGKYENWYYFSIGDIKKLFIENGFEIVSMYPNELLRKKFFYTALLRIANRLFTITKLRVIIDLVAWITRRATLGDAKHISVLAKNV